MTSSGILKKDSPTGASIAVLTGSLISSHSWPLRRVLRERGRVLRVGRSRDRSRTLFRRYEAGAEGASSIRPFLDIARWQDRAPAADRRHPSHRTSSGKMTAGHEWNEYS